MTIGSRLQEKGQITIPTRIRRKLNLRKGDLVVFEETSEGVLLKPADILPTGELRQKLAAEIAKMRSRFSDLSDEEVQTLVDKAIRQARSN